MGISPSTVYFAGVNAGGGGGFHAPRWSKVSTNPRLESRIPAMNEVQRLGRGSSAVLDERTHMYIINQLISRLQESRTLSSPQIVRGKRVFSARPLYLFLKVGVLNFKRSTHVLSIATMAGAIWDFEISSSGNAISPSDHEGGTACAASHRRPKGVVAVRAAGVMDHPGRLCPTPRLESRGLSLSAASSAVPRKTL